MTSSQTAPLQRPHRLSERRVAVIGGGMIAQVHRRAAILAGATVVGVLGHSYDDSQAIAAGWDSTRPFRDLNELLSADLDVVHVCTPNATHARYALAALDAGTSVICEKPIATTSADAMSLAQAAEAGAARGLVAAVPFIYRYHPVVREIRERARSGELGTVLAIHGSYLQDWMLSTSGGWRVDPTVGGRSRAFADIGSHWFDLVEWVSGERVAQLSASTVISVPQRRMDSTVTFGAAAATKAPLSPVATEDIAMVLGRTRAGVPVSATISQVSAGRKNRLWFELDGTRHSAAFDQENPEHAWFGGLETNELFLRGPGVGSAEQRRLSRLPAGHPQGYAQCFEAFVADVYAALDGERPDGLPTFADGLRAAQLTDAVLAAADNQQWMEVPS